MTPVSTERAAQYWNCIPSGSHLSHAFPRFHFFWNISRADVAACWLSSAASRTTGTPTTVKDGKDHVPNIETGHHRPDLRIEFPTTKLKHHNAEDKDCVQATDVYANVIGGMNDDLGTSHALEQP